MTELQIIALDSPSEAEKLEYHSRAGIALPPGRSSYLFLKNTKGELFAGSHLTFNYDFVVLESIWVDPSVQSSGYGMRVYNEIEELARKRNCRKILLSSLSSMNAMGFWTKMGFKIAGQIEDCPKGETLYYLYKIIS